MLKKTTMIYKIKTIGLLIISLITVTSCAEDLDDNAVAVSEINDFVWKGMNAVYLYKADVADLANDRFTSNEDYIGYLNGFSSPEALFETLKHEPSTVDRFSRITDNYFDLINSQQGTSVSKGIEFNLYFVPGSSTEVFGAITLVLNNSVADNAGLQRGQIFRAVNGINLTEANFTELLTPNSYSLNFADYNTNGTVETDDDTITLNGTSTALTAVTYTENPVHKAEIISLPTSTIGYLMYNGFNSSFNSELNDAFGFFKSNGVTDLVIDLRYNGGGSVQTAAYLGSMVTGQYTGEIYSKLFYNENLESNNRNFLFTDTIEGVGAINSLNLTRVYVLTTNRRTASASELLINSLSTYVQDVIVIGENTVGKTQASVVVYDSPGLFTTQNVNPSHTYAMQPLVANSTNSQNVLVPADGLVPDIEISESPSTLGVLGDENEPLLAAAIASITGTGRFSVENTFTLKTVDTSVFIPKFEQEMHIDALNID